MAPLANSRWRPDHFSAANARAVHPGRVDGLVRHADDVRPAGNRRSRLFAVDRPGPELGSHALGFCEFFFLNVIAMLLGMIGMYLCYVGIVVTIPLYYLIIAAAYDAQVGYARV